MIPPSFSPPYDSPIEKEFAYLAVKHLDQSIDFKPQHSVETLCGRFILDFLLTTKTGYRVGIECDGKEFHNTSRDEWRDAMILGDGHADAIYRLRGTDLVNRLEATIFIISLVEPSLFSERGKKNLSSLVPPRFRNIETESKGECLRYRLPPEEEDDYDTDKYSILIYRCTRAEGRRQFWKTAYKYAQSCGGGQLDAVIQAYREKSDT